MPETKTSRPSSPEVEAAIDEVRGICAALNQQMLVGAKEFQQADEDDAAMLDRLLDAQHAASVAATVEQLVGQAESEMRLRFLQLAQATTSERQRLVENHLVASWAAQSAALRASEEALLWSAQWNSGMLVTDNVSKGGGKAIAWYSGSLDDEVEVTHDGTREGKLSALKEAIRQAQARAALSPPPSPTTEAPE